MWKDRNYCFLAGSVWFSVAFLHVLRLLSFSLFSSLCLTLLITVPVLHLVLPDCWLGFNVSTCVSSVCVCIWCPVFRTSFVFWTFSTPIFHLVFYLPYFMSCSFLSSFFGILNQILHQHACKGLLRFLLEARARKAALIKHVSAETPAEIQSNNLDFYLNSHSNKM